MPSLFLDLRDLTVLIDLWAKQASKRQQIPDAAKYEVPQLCRRSPDRIMFDIELSLVWEDGVADQVYPMWALCAFSWIQGHDFTLHVHFVRRLIRAYSYR